MTMPAGEYYVGDLCYVIGDKWNDFCDKTIAGRGCLDGEMKLSDGSIFATYGTAYGDGCYLDQERRPYAVDAGLIGCIQIKDCDAGVTAETISQRGLGQVVSFPFPFKTSSEFGVIKIGHIQINTGDDAEEDDLDYDPEYDS